jgi:hypothetical protein
MSSSPNRAPNSAGKQPRRKDVSLDLTTARRMLPLVRSIVSDIVDTQNRLTRLAPERDALDDSRRALDWAARQRRYAIHDELSQAEKALTVATQELDALGVSLVDPKAGQVDFPTRINGRQAVFSWRLGEDGVAHWRYAGEKSRRPIPTDWQSGSPIRFRGDV